jgi:hypothetical protein
MDIEVSGCQILHRCCAKGAVPSHPVNNPDSLLFDLQFQTIPAFPRHDDRDNFSLLGCNHHEVWIVSGYENVQSEQLSVLAGTSKSTRLSPPPTMPFSLIPPFAHCPVGLQLSADC